MPALDQVTCRGEFPIAIDGVERAVDVVALDSFRLQFPPGYGTRQVAPPLAGTNPVHCKRGVVPQSDLLESIEYGIDHVVRHILGQQCSVKLLARAGSC